MNQQLRSAVALVEETATMPGLRQWYGMWLKNGKCCMGARLAPPSRRIIPATPTGCGSSPHGPAAPSPSLSS